MEREFPFSPEPDVLLHIPIVKVDDINLEVNDVRARVSLHAAVGNLVALDVGADAMIQRVKLEIKGVEAQALLKVRLEKVYAILERTLLLIDNHPEILQSLLKPLGETIGSVGRTVEKTVPELGGHLGRTVEKTVPELGGHLGRTVEKTVPELGGRLGRTVENTVPQLGGAVGRTVENTVPQLGGAVGQTVQNTVPQLGGAVGNTVQNTVPQLGGAVGQTLERTAPQIGGAVGQVGGAVGRSVEKATPDLGGGGGQAAQQNAASGGAAGGQVGPAAVGGAGGRAAAQMAPAMEAGGQAAQAAPAAPQAEGQVAEQPGPAAVGGAGGRAAAQMAPAMEAGGQAAQAAPAVAQAGGQVAEQPAPAAVSGAGGQAATHMAPAMAEGGGQAGGRRAEEQRRSGAGGDKLGKEAEQMAPSVAGAVRENAEKSPPGVGVAVAGSRAPNQPTVAEVPAEASKAGVSSTVLQPGGGAGSKRMKALSPDSPEWTMPGWDEDFSGGSGGGPNAEENRGEGAPSEGAPSQKSGGAAFDGSAESLRQWRHEGGGSVDHQRGELLLSASAGPGLLYFRGSRANDFQLRLQYRPEQGCQMGVVLRFRDPNAPVPDRMAPKRRYHYDNPAFAAMHTGFEVELGSQRPAIEPGTFHGILMGSATGAQLHATRGEVSFGEWNELEVTVQGDDYRVRLNGEETARFHNVDSYRGHAAHADADAGFIGILMRAGRMRVRRIELEAQQPSAGRRAAAPEAHDASRGAP